MISSEAQRRTPGASDEALASLNLSRSPVERRRWADELVVLRTRKRVQACRRGNVWAA